MTLFNRLSDVALAAPDKHALHFEGKDWTYGGLVTEIKKTACVLCGDLGLKRGDRFGYYGANTDEQLLLVFAASLAGLIMVPFNWRLAPMELSYIAEHCRLSAILADKDFLAKATELRQPCPSIAAEAQPDALASLPTLRHSVTEIASPSCIPREGVADDPLLIVYTSGTTGRPKGAVLTQDAVIANAENSFAMHEMSADDHILTILPMFHVGGLNIQTVPALLAGATVTLHRRFEPGPCLAAFETDRPTLTVQVPATLEALMAHADWAKADLSSLRALATGSTDVPRPLIKALHRRDVPVIQIYGASETAPIAICQRPGDAFGTVGSIGQAAKLCHIRLVDDTGADVPEGEKGEVWVRGPNVMSHYWENPGATAESLTDGWFHSGDVAYRDEHGFYWFADRIKNVIISGGENIYPAEIERLLRDVPFVSDAMVTGIDDDRWGQVPMAVVTTSPDLFDPNAIFDHLSGTLARYKHPKRIFRVDHFPRTALGKVLKEDVKALILNLLIKESSIA